MITKRKRKIKFPDMPTKRDMPMMLYDLGIEDLEERRLKALPFRDGFEVMEFLGHDKTSVVTRMVDKKGKFVTGTDGKNYAVRTKKA
jgi:hypothetical protein